MRGESRAGFTTFVRKQLWAELETPTMDVLLVMFASIITVMTALSFVEIRRIRKKIQSK